MSTTTETSHPVQYCPLSPDTMEQFAFSACEQLGPEFQDPEVARGFAHCLATVARVQANNLNRQANKEVL